MHKIIICMGSSCFARGNRENLKCIQDYLEKHNLEAQVNVTGTLCKGNCGQGPNILIDDNWYENVSPPLLMDILRETFKDEITK